MARERTHVRVFEDTKAALQLLIADMEEAVSQGHGQRFWQGENLGTAELIAELLRRELAHRARSKKASRKARREPATLTPPEPPASDLGAEGLTPPLEPDEVLDIAEAVPSRWSERRKEWADDLNAGG